MAHVLISILGLCLFFLIMRSMTRIALIDRHYRDWFAEAAGRVVYAVVSLRLRRNRDTRALHATLLWFFPAYLLSLILIYFVGAMIAFVLLYWGMGAVTTWRQAFLASGSALNTTWLCNSDNCCRPMACDSRGCTRAWHCCFPFYFHPRLSGGHSGARRQDVVAVCPHGRSADRCNTARMVPASRHRRRYEGCVGGLGRLVPHACRHPLCIADAHHVSFRPAESVMGPGCGSSVGRRHSCNLLHRNRRRGSSQNMRADRNARVPGNRRRAPAILAGY